MSLQTIESGYARNATETSGGSDFFSAGSVNALYQRKQEYHLGKQKQKMKNAR